MDLEKRVAAIEAALRTRNMHLSDCSLYLEINALAIPPVYAFPRVCSCWPLLEATPPPNDEEEETPEDV